MVLQCTTELIIIAPGYWCFVLQKWKLLVAEVIRQIDTDVLEAQDNLLAAKLIQTEQANRSRAPARLSARAPVRGSGYCRRARVPGVV